MVTKKEWKAFYVGSIVGVIVIGTFITILAFLPSSKPYSNGYKQGQIDCINGNIRYVPDTTVTTTIEYLELTSQ